LALKETENAGDSTLDFPGKVSFRGAIYLQTPSSEGGKLSNLNNMVGVFEYETDEMGNCSSKTWEWK
jgi:hypothetical protein